MFWLLFMIECLFIVLILFGGIVGMLFEVAALKFLAVVITIFAVVIMLAMAYIIAKSGH